MVLKVIARGEDREQAIGRLSNALAEMRIEGITHNATYLRAVLAHPAFREGTLHTDFLGQFHAEWVGAGQPSPVHAPKLQA
jgi:acetyl/propionyl-CoA carboxylase alpha subunit